MSLSREDARKEFESQRVQNIIQSIAERLGADWTRVEPEGWGGQGLIIRLECPLYDQPLCAKIPHEDTDRSGRALGACLKEARINEAMTAAGTNLVPRLLCYGEGGEYLLREWAQGTLLEDEIRQGDIRQDEIRQDDIRQVDIRERIRLAYLEWETATEAFDLIHDKAPVPYVIRDLKPRNMILSPDRKRLSMIDLGSCRMEAAMVSKRKLRMRERLGSGKFLHWPPEQLTEDAERCSRKVDYFALGVMVFDTLLGRSPYSNLIKDILPAEEKYAEEYKAAKKAIESALAEKAIPDDLAELMIRALVPDPDEREFVRR